MPENDLTPEQLVRDTICRIVSCTGERYTVAPVVVDILYVHLRRVCSNLMAPIHGTPDDFSNLISSLRHYPVQLARVMQYFVIMSSGNQVKESSLDDADIVNHHHPDSQDMVLDMDDLLDPVGFKPLKKICDSLGFCLPTESRPYVHSPRLTKGRQLRLARIDAAVSRLSVDNYLEFARLRQSSSFLPLCRPSLAQAQLIRWLLELKAGDDVMSASKSPKPRINYQTLCIIGHLMTGAILDVVDTILFYRPKVGIDIESPFTPVEVEQAVLRVNRV